MKLSKYCHKVSLGEYTVFYNSLRMKPIYLTKDEVKKLNHYLENEEEPELSDLSIFRELEEYKIINVDDEVIINRVRNYIPKPYVSLAYFILTEQCNLACRYCFLGNCNLEIPKITDYPMSKKTAKIALDFFIKQTMQNKDCFDDEKEIIFYGGEPLLNFETLKYVVDLCKEYQEQGKISKKLRFSIVTNGLLLSDEIINFFILNDIGVSISIDGASEEDNSLRVNKNGDNIYTQLREKLKNASEKGLEYGLSVTISDKTLKNVDDMIRMVEELGVKSVCFNILLKNDGYTVSNDYYERATEYIISFHEKTKGKGIYEERFSRKLKSFINSKIYFSDCAATSGSQIVITPDGSVGVCHGRMDTRDFFFGSIYDDELIVQDNEIVKEWSLLTPILRKDCESCIALGICGGGCPINAKKLSSVEGIHSIDKSFCIHAKYILEYLLKELLRLELEE